MWLAYRLDKATGHLGIRNCDITKFSCKWTYWRSFSLFHYKMFRVGVRRFTTTAWRAANAVAQMEGPNPYGIKVSSAQGVVKGLVGGQ